MPVADTLLRLAEEPVLYTPKWSTDILTELERVLRKRLGYTNAQATRRVSAMKGAFPAAMVMGYEDLVPVMTNDPKDRHVLAAAVRCGAHFIVSDNRKHFPPRSLVRYGLECLTADEFLSNQYHLDPDVFIGVLTAQAEDIGWTLRQLLSKHVPSLSQLITVR
jgi:predicted nucleic acid-binding protein